MKTQQATYNGNHVFGFNASLYDYDDVNFKESKEDILAAFKADYEDTIARALRNAGMELVELSYYSPQYYNYAGDSIDPTIRVTDPEGLKEWVRANHLKIDEAASKNKSYDGYIATTPRGADEELEEIERTGTPSVIVLALLLHDITKGFEIIDHLVTDTIEED